MMDVDIEPNAGKAWTEQDLKSLAELAAAKLPAREIAERLGRSEYSVRTKAKQARISLQAGRAATPRKPR
jgi:IS30 family transposase